MPTMNITTAQYLLAAEQAKASGRGHACRGECPVGAAETAWIDGLLGTLPDVDQAVVGQVLLHAAMRLPTLAKQALSFGVAKARLSDHLTDTVRGMGADLVRRETGA